MEKALNEVIENFMISETYQEMLRIYSIKDFEEVRGNFYSKLSEITAMATENDELEIEKVENLVIHYLSNVEKLSLIIGFKFAFALFQDLNTIGGEIDVQS